MILLLTIIFILLAYFLNRFLLKSEVIVYIITFASSLFFIYFNEEIFAGIIIEGYLSVSLFFTVMIAGAFPYKTTISKRLRSVRKMYSIMGFILIVPHTIIYLYSSINGSVSYEWFGIISFVLMVPLFISSFLFIRKRFSSKQWFKLHKLAYVSYLALYIHVMITTTDNAFIYTVFFMIYSVLKLNNFVFKKHSIYKAIPTSIIIVSLVFIFTGNSFEQNTYEPVLSNDVVLIDGTYYGSAQSYEDHVVELYVTVENGEISSVELIDCGCTVDEKKGYYVDMANIMVNRIVTANSLEIDIVSGATETSYGILEAIDSALQQAVE